MEEARHIKEGFNVKHILKQFALKYKVDDLSLDYSLVSYKTYLQKDDKIDLNTLNEVDDNIFKKIDTNINTFLDSPYKIVQLYTINIFKRKSSFYPIIINVQSNEDNTSLKAMVDTSRIPEAKMIESSIKSTILNICAYRGVIIGLGWKNINANIRDIANKLKGSDNHPPYYEIEIAALPPPKINRIAVRKIITKNNKISSLAHDSFLLNGGFFKINKNELLLEYQKPIYDSNWRNIYGVLFGVNSEYPIGITAGKGIRVDKDNDSIFYYAEYNGYVSVVSNVMQISNIVTLDNINAKNIINIQEQGIKSLIVKNDNLTKDVISSGVDLDIENINIIGNVGAANITANNLSIKGQVHIKSAIKTNNANISYLKGRLIANQAEVRVCENATIECDNLFLNNTSGSKIYVTNAKIANIKSNNIIFVQGELLIGKMIGHNNEFILHPCIYGKNKDKFDNFNRKINNINKLQTIFAPFKSKLNYDYTTNKFLSSELNIKDASKIDKNMFDWNSLLSKYKDKFNNSSKLIDQYNILMSSFDEKIALINNNISLELKKMFDIKVTFNTMCNNDFYVRIINFFGVSSRHHINPKKDNAIKSFKLENDDDNIRIILYKE